MYRSSLFIVGLTILLLAGAANAAVAEPFPGVPPDQRLLDAQEKADQLYEKGDYDRALVVYRDDLARGGDKFAQYMVGYMYLAGQAVTQNAVTATAWYRLAAERDEESFVRARDTLMDAMNDAQRRECDEKYVELREEFGDIVIVSSLIRDDLQELSPLVTMNTAINSELMQRSQYGGNDKLLNQIRVNVNTRLAYLLRISDSDPGITEQELQKISQLHKQVQRDMAALDRIQFKD
jgi:TPR repeat protein